MIYLVTNQQRLFDDNIRLCSVEDVLLWAEDKSEIELDTETMGFDPYTCQLLTVQLGNSKDQFIIDVTTVNIQLFKALLENQDKLFILQNAKFDLKFLFHQRISVKNVYDTFLAETILNNGDDTVRKSLDVLCRKYCRVELDKEVRLAIQREGLTTRVLKYCANDVRYLSIIKQKQLEEATRKNLLSALNLDNKFVRVLAYSEYCGFKLHTEKWQVKLKKDLKILHEKMELLDHELASLKIDKFINSQLDLFSPSRKVNINWSSSKQVIDLFTRLNIDCTIIDKKTGKEKKSVESKHLSHLRKKYSIVDKYITYKKAEKVCSTYGKTFLEQISKVTNRLHTQFNQLQDTGRLSSGGKNKQTKEEYINFQNIPADEETRSCFIAEPGNKLVVADYSGQEQIILANKSLDKDLLFFYQQDLGDMHSFVASKIFPELAECSLDEIKEQHKSKRGIAKSAGFAINYGGNGFTIADNLGIEREKGEEVYQAYFRAFPGLRNYFRRMSDDVIKKGFIEFNEITRRKYFVPNFEEFLSTKAKFSSGFWDSYNEIKNSDDPKYDSIKRQVKNFYKAKSALSRKALNYPIQGTAADITKYAEVLFFRHLEENNLLFTVLIPNQVHDEIIAECPEAIAEEISIVLKECMEKAGERFCKTVLLKATPVITDYWTH